MQRKRVVVTGMGVLCPVGNNVQQSWKNIINGVSGIKTITEFDCEQQVVNFAGMLQNFDEKDYIAKSDSKKMGSFIKYAMIAADEAIKDSGIKANKDNEDRIGVSIGTGIGGLLDIEKNVNIFRDKGPRKLSPFCIPASIANMASGNISIKYGFKGPNFAVVSACTTGTHNIGNSARMIEYGDADIMIAGGSEMSTTNTSIAGFAAARALSTRNDKPHEASRPWDKDRDGFVLGNGAGVLVLEEYQHAKKRGAKIYAELAGYGINSDAYHMTLPSENGQGASKCILNALNNANIKAEQIDYINAHGTSTIAGDLAETNAIKNALGKHAYKTKISSNKSMIGHLLGAAGAVEAIFTIMSIKDQIAPPTINIQNQDPECDLDYCANEAKQTSIEYALSNSFGFGGTNATIILAKID